MTNPPHILTVTETTINGVTEREHEIDCPGITDRCQALRLCENADCNLDNDDDRTEMTAHGEHHRWIDESATEGWYIPTTNCYLVDHDNLPDAADGLPPGRHLVHPYFGDGFELELIVQPSDNLTAANA